MIDSLAGALGPFIPGIFGLLGAFLAWLGLSKLKERSTEKRAAELAQLRAQAASRTAVVETEQDEDARAAHEAALDIKAGDAKAVAEQRAAELRAKPRLDRSDLDAIRKRGEEAERIMKERK